MCAFPFFTLSNDVRNFIPVILKAAGTEYYYH